LFHQNKRGTWLAVIKVTVSGTFPVTLEPRNARRAHGFGLVEHALQLLVVDALRFFFAPPFLRSLLVRSLQFHLEDVTA
jgi:hypothetical protein